MLVSLKMRMPSKKTPSPLERKDMHHLSNMDALKPMRVPTFMLWGAPFGTFLQGIRPLWNFPFVQYASQMRALATNVMNLFSAVHSLIEPSAIKRASILNKML